jgi:hypothetical protein
VASNRARRAAAGLAKRTTPDVQVQLVSGVIVALAGGAVIVNVGGQEARVRVFRDFVPYVGDTVVMLRQGMDLVAVGSATVRERPDQAIVTNVDAAAGQLGVEWEGGVYLVAHARTFVPTPGQLVALAWTRSGGYATCELSARLQPIETVVGDVLLEQLPAAPFGTERILATEAAGWTSEGWERSGRPLAQAGDTVRAGVWFYGGAVRAFAEGRTIERMSMTLPVQESRGAVGLYLHQHDVRGSALPATRGAGITVRPTSGETLEIELPDAWVEAFVAGPCGIRTTDQGAYTLVTGTNASTLSGALTLDWSR